MGPLTIPPPRVNDNATAALQELRAIREILAALFQLVDEFAGVYLNARFCGRGTDRWSRRRP